MSRMLSNGELEGDNNSLRPETLQTFCGQSKMKDNLQVFLNAAKGRNEALDHVLIHGPPGLGKTTLANIIAHEMDANIKTTAGPVLSKVGDLAAILTNLQEKDILFIDEIHRLNRVVEESLYSAMEDFALDIIIGEGATARILRIDLPKFTIVGATTKLGLMTNPLKDRFGIPISLDFYLPGELKDIILRYSTKFGFNINSDAAIEIAKRSRGTPRIALRLLRRVRDFSDKMDIKITQDALYKLNIDNIGLDFLDHKYLKYVFNVCKGGPVGIETIVSGIAEDQTTIEDVIEPFLLQIGFVIRSTKGRLLTDECIIHIKKYL